MKALLASIAPQVLDVLTPLFLAALSWASVQLAIYIRAHAKNVAVQGVLLRLNDATYTAVGAVEQTVVAAAKASEIDGRLTGASAAAAKQAALDEIKSHLGAKGLAELTKILGVKPEDLAAFLSSRVESAVQSMPESKPAVNVANLAVSMPPGTPSTAASEAITQDITPPTVANRPPVEPTK